MDKDLLDKTFYMTAMFSEIKSENNWSINEVKTIVLLFSRLSEYKIYLPDFQSEDDGILVDNIKDLVNKVPSEFIFSKKEFMDITGVDSSHLAREINKVRKGLVGKSIHMPHPLEINDPNSGRSLTWFTEIMYSNLKGELYVEINRKALDRIIVFANYIQVNFSNIVTLKNPYAFTMYVALMVMIKCSRTHSFEIKIDDLKHKLGLVNKYKNMHEFRVRVLDVVLEEINQTNLTLEYELIKSGRKFTHVKFDFTDKDQSNKNKTLKKHNSEHVYLPQLQIAEAYTTEKNALRSYGISVKAIEKYFEPLTGYQIEHIQQAIARLETEIARGKIIANKPAYFATVLKSVVDDSQALLQAQSIEAEKQQRIEQSNMIKKAWDVLDRYITDNEGYVLTIIDSVVRSIPVVADEVIEVKDKIIELYTQHDISKIQIPFNSLAKVTTALGDKYSIGAGNIMYFMSEVNCVLGDASEKIKALKESLAFHTEMIETVEDAKLKAHHKDNIEKLKNKLLVLLGVDMNLV